MKILTEKEAEKFLEKEKFSVIERFFVKSKSQLENKKFSSSFVAKASGKKIIHKKQLGGVILDISSTKKAEHAYNKLKKIAGTEEVLFQKQLKGKEFLLGIKKTPEFGHSIIFGVGGSGVEQKKDFSFRICPIELNDSEEMIVETVIGKSVSLEEKQILKKEIMKLCELVKKFPEIKELDINPLMIEKYVGYVVDARIVFE